MTKRRQALGREGEERAARYLEARGYRIIARNVRADRVEIDLIVSPARSPRTCVIVEVKTRRVRGAPSGERHAEAAEAVDREKQARLRRGGLAWLAGLPRSSPGPTKRNARLRFDVVTCVCSQDSQCGTGTKSGTGPSEGVESINRIEPVEPVEPWSIRHWEAAF